MRDMITMYALEDFNSRVATIKCRELYPNRRQQDKNLFQKLKTSQYWKFSPKKKSRTALIRNMYQKEEALDIIQNEPSTSTRQISRHTELSHASVHRILGQPQLHPYNICPVQNLLPGDVRIKFVNLS